jgi:hypothetical protein
MHAMCGRTRSRTYSSTRTNTNKEAHTSTYGKLHTHKHTQSHTHEFTQAHTEILYAKVHLQKASYPLLLHAGTTASCCSLQSGCWRTGQVQELHYSAPGAACCIPCIVSTLCHIEFCRDLPLLRRALSLCLRDSSTQLYQSACASATC